MAKPSVNHDYTEVAAYSVNLTIGVDGRRTSFVTPEIVAAGRPAALSPSPPQGKTALFPRLWRPFMQTGIAQSKMWKKVEGVG
jgi:hypothetical protein